MKDVLKELAEKLPEKYESEFVENDLKMACDHGYCKTYVFVSDERTPIENSKGTTVLLQFIEEQGLEITILIHKKQYRCHVDTWNDESVHASEWCPTLAEAVAKAALDVARRMK